MRDAGKEVFFGADVGGVVADHEGVRRAVGLGGNAARQGAVVGGDAQVPDLPLLPEFQGRFQHAAAGHAPHPAEKQEVHLFDPEPAQPLLVEVPHDQSALVVGLEGDDQIVPVGSGQAPQGVSHGLPAARTPEEEVDAPLVEGFFEGVGRSRVGAAESETADGKAGAAEGGVGFEVHNGLPMVMNFSQDTESRSLK